METPPGSARRSTLRDVARVAGVSIKTASRVVNGGAGVAASKIEAVQEAVRRLDYRPDRQAASLRRGDRRTAVLGVLLEDLSNPFSAEAHRALEDVARAHDSLILAGSLDEDPAREHELVRAFADRRTDALVIAAASDHQGFLAREIPDSTPVVFIDRAPRGLHADAVVTDNLEASANAVAHLHGSGHRRIGYVGDLLSIRTAAERHAGYLAGHQRQGLVPDPALTIPDVHDQVAAEAAVTRLLDLVDPPTALFTARNDLTVAAITVLQRRHLSDRIALVGFDDFPLADLLSPGVTVIAQDPYAIGRRAGEIVFARLAGDTSAPTTHVIASRLIPRGSGELPAPP